MQTQFKVGDIVKIIEREHSVPEVNNGLGMVGTIIGMSDNDVEVQSTQFVFRGLVRDSWFFGFDQIELVDSVKASVVSSNICSRCGNQMVPKKSQGLLSGEFEVMKCESCGYCQ